MLLCPQCGQPRIRLGAVKAQLLELIERRPGLAIKALHKGLFVDRQSPTWRSPRDRPAVATLNVHISQLNEILREHGFAVQRRDGGYFLISIEEIAA